MRGLFADIAETKECTESVVARVVYEIWRTCGLFTCFCCERPVCTLCDTCAALPMYSAPHCALCEKFSIKGTTHAECTPKVPYFTHSIAFFEYTKVIKKLFAVYKYKQAFQYQQVIEDFAGDYIKIDPFLLVKTVFSSIDALNVVLFPIPMTTKKQEDRGFSPAYELSVIVGRALQAKYGCCVKICAGVVKKVGDVTSQARKDRRQRLLSLQKEYQVIESAVDEFTRQPIDLFVVVDDVVTTGATTTAVIEAIAKHNMLAEKLQKIPIVRFSFARA